MKCIGPCGKNHPAKDIVWVFGNGQALCRSCFPQSVELPREVREQQIALGLPPIAPSIRKKKGDAKGQIKLWEE